MRDHILLVDTDSKIPNLALARIAGFHRDRGDHITLTRLGFSGYPKTTKPKIVKAEGYNRVYVSTIFTHNRDKVEIKGASDVVCGGTGIDLTVKLPREMEAMPMDLSIYPEHGDTAFGFITRGCPNACEFCFVPRKEGRLRKFSEIKDIVRPGVKQVKFLDNNFLAYSGHEDILKQLIRMRIKCTFSQGLDIRCLTEQNARLLKKLNYWEEYIFAFDNIRLRRLIERKLDLLKRVGFHGRLKFYVFVSPRFTSLSDDVFRVKFCIQHQILPYVMRENTCWGDNSRSFYTDLASWCNQPKIFKRLTFENFLKKRHPQDPERQEYSAQIYYDNHPDMTDFWNPETIVRRKRDTPVQLQMFEN